MADKAPSAGGEHVINNNVLRIYNDIAKDFVDDLWRKSDSLEAMIRSGRLSTASKVLKDISQPLDQQTTDLVQKQLVVNLSKPYVDQNAAKYGDDVRALRNAIKQYMMFFYAVLESTSSTAPEDLNLAAKNAKDEVKRMVMRENFIDQDILKIWKKDHPRDVFRFDSAKTKVVSMIEKLVDEPKMVQDWVKELTKAYKAGKK